MSVYQYTIRTKAGEGFGSIEAESEAAAREFLASQHEGELQDQDDNPYNNDVESIDLRLIED